MIGNDWDKYLDDIFKSDTFLKLMKNLDEEYKKYIVYPKRDDLFNAFKLTPFNNIKAVIIGQDPYHNKEEAEGLAFSVKEGIKIPPSLKNIFKELNSDIGIDIPTSGSLVKWASEGVLLINSVLSVRENKPGSHNFLNWEEITNNIIKIISSSKSNIVFILWGKKAEEKQYLIDKKKHLVLVSTHPSPFSTNKGFFGSKPFSKTNAYLINNKIKEIDWTL